LASWKKAVQTGVFPAFILYKTAGMSQKEAKTAE
jgi:hypothetical protein